MRFEGVGGTQNQALGGTYPRAKGQAELALEGHRCMLPLGLSPPCPSSSWHCLTHGVAEWAGGGNIHRPASYATCMYVSGVNTSALCAACQL